MKPSSTATSERALASTNSLGLQFNGLRGRELWALGKYVEQLRSGYPKAVDAAGKPVEPDDDDDDE
jgi:hypothetical protein